MIKWVKNLFCRHLQVNVTYVPVLLKVTSCKVCGKTFKREVVK